MNRPNGQKRAALLHVGRSEANTMNRRSFLQTLDDMRKSGDPMAWVILALFCATTAWVVVLALGFVFGFVTFVP